MNKTTQEIHKIQVTKEVEVQYDIADGWFGIVDADWTGYDQMGAVTMGTDDLDALIVGLGMLRERVIIAKIPYPGQGVLYADGNNQE